MPLSLGANTPSKQVEKEFDDAYIPGKNWEETK
jgi:hypothetical protein